MFWAGAFGMKNAVQQSTRLSIYEIMKRFIDDLNSNHGKLETRFFRGSREIFTYPTLSNLLRHLFDTFPRAHFKCSTPSLLRASVSERFEKLPPKLADDYP